MNEAAAGDPFSPIHQAAAIMAPFPHPWWVSGGWAIDLFAGRVTRPHSDLEIGIAREHQADLRTLLAGRDLFKAVDHAWVPWEAGERIEHPIFQILSRGSDPAELEFFLNGVWDGLLHFRRDSSITYPMDRLITPSRFGIPVIAPELQLLHKARHMREKDEHDFETVLPLLDEERRAWLRAGLERFLPGHVWLERLHP